MKSFTLAEVLITLGIIGVVAAMTLPAIINNSQNKELEARLKKSYSILQQGLNLMSSEEGQIVNWINYPTTVFMLHIKNTFQTQKIAVYRAA